MPQYLVAGYLPDNYDPSHADEATGREIHALNKEMIAAGVRKFACGLGAAKSLRAQTDGGVLISDGPYLGTKEHIGGFWILECADMGERWHGHAKASPPPGGRSRYVKSSSIRQPTSNRATTATERCPLRDRLAKKVHSLEKTMGETNAPDVLPSGANLFYFDSSRVV